MKNKHCDGSGIIWLEPPKVETLMVCGGCRACREVQRRKKDLPVIQKNKQNKHNSPLTKEEIKCLESGGFRCDELSFRESMKFLRQQNSLSVDFYRTCLNIYDAEEILCTTRDLLVSKLKSKPPKLLGLKFKGHWLLPNVQFYGFNLLPNFEKVLATIWKSDPHVMTISRWLEFKNCDLEVGQGAVSPREWLILGLPLKEVLILAKDFGSCY